MGIGHVTAQTRGSGPLGLTKDQPGYREGGKCYACNQKGYLAANCPNRSLYCSTVTIGPVHGLQHGHHCQGVVNGIPCDDILVDTGATKTLVRGDLVQEEDILQGKMTINCVHGDTVSYPIATVKIKVGGKATEAAVSSTLPVSALLGWDIPDLLTLVSEGRESEPAKQSRGDATIHLNYRPDRPLYHQSYPPGGGHT